MILRKNQLLLLEAAVLFAVVGYAAGPPAIVHFQRPPATSKAKFPYW